MPLVVNPDAVQEYQEGLWAFMDAERGASKEMGYGDDQWATKWQAVDKAYERKMVGLWRQSFPLARAMCDPEDLHVVTCSPELPTSKVLFEQFILPMHMAARAQFPPSNELQAEQMEVVLHLFKSSLALYHGVLRSNSSVLNDAKAVLEGTLEVLSTLDGLDKETKEAVYQETERPAGL